MTHLLDEFGVKTSCITVNYKDWAVTLHVNRRFIFLLISYKAESKFILRTNQFKLTEWLKKSLDIKKFQ